MLPGRAGLIDKLILAISHYANSEKQNPFPATESNVWLLRTGETWI